MKKIFILCIFSLFTTIIYAQTLRTTEFAFALVMDGKYAWGDWEPSDMYITINTEDQVVTIYSPVTQYYKIIGTYNDGNIITDSSGGRQLAYKILDKDNDRGRLRLRVESNGNTQLYVDFRDCAWVYNVKIIQ